MFADGLPVDILNGLEKVSSALTDFIVKAFFVLTAIFLVLVHLDDGNRSAV